MKKMKNYKGITLVALIVTIIIMILLAGIAISITVNDGLINRAENNIKTNNLAQDKEQLEIYVMGILQTKSTIVLDDLNGKLDMWTIIPDGDNINCKSPNNNEFCVDKYGTITIVSE